MATATAKKTLLAKLKKDMLVSKKKTSGIAKNQAGDESLSLAYIQKEVVRKILDNIDNDEAYRNAIQQHVNFYPEDKYMLRILDLKAEDRMALFTKISATEPFDMGNSIKSFLDAKKISGNEGAIDENNVVPVIISRLEELVSSSANIFVSDLVQTETHVFEPLLLLEFHSDKSESAFCERLVKYLLQTIPTPRPDLDAFLRKTVDAYLYEHRFDEIFEILEDDQISSVEKQEYVVEHIRNEFEATRSKLFFLLVWNIVEKKTYPFNRSLDNLLLRFIQDKKFLPSLKKQLTLALDVLIHNNRTDKYLSKFFLTKQGLQKFKNQVLPHLESTKSASRYIRSIIRAEMDPIQPYLYRHAYRVGWKSYLSIIQKVSHSTLSSSYDLLLAELQGSRQSIVVKILEILGDKNYNRKTLRTVIQQFIFTFKPNERKALGKLLLVDEKSLKTFFEDTAVQNYVDRVNDLVINTTYNKNTTSKSKPASIMSWETITRQHRVNLEKTRFEVNDFVCVLIEPLKTTADDGFKKYCNGRYENSSSKWVPNDRFYYDCVDGKTQQKGSVFTVNEVSMRVYYYISSKELILQDERWFNVHSDFVSIQVKLYDIQHPLEYIQTFSKVPLFQHQTDAMTRWRESVVSRLQECDIPASNKIEQVIFDASGTVQDYVESISRILLVTDKVASPFFAQSCYFITILKKGWVNLNALPQILEGTLEFAFHLLYPEYFINKSSICPILLQKASVHLNRIYKSLVMRAFIIHHPMARIPILLTEPDITDALLSDVESVINTEIIYGFQDEPFSNSLIGNAQEFSEIAPYFNNVPIIVAEERTNLPVVSAAPTADMEVMSNPFYSFYEDALQLVDEL
jgi:hypothetical protein